MLRKVWATRERCGARAKSADGGLCRALPVKGKARGVGLIEEVQQWAYRDEPPKRERRDSPSECRQPAGVVADRDGKIRAPRSPPGLQVRAATDLNSRKRTVGRLPSGDGFAIERALAEIAHQHQPGLLWAATTAGPAVARITGRKTLSRR
jgi:hypothetical protein